MTGRAYTVAEIDRMREAVRSYGGVGSGWRSRDGTVESHVQTYMLAGIEPEVLERELRAAHEREIASMNELQYQVIRDGQRWNIYAGGWSPADAVPAEWGNDWAEADAGGGMVMVYPTAANTRSEH